MLRYDRQTKPGLVALYDIRPGNGAGLFLQPRSQHRAIRVKALQTYTNINITIIAVITELLYINTFTNELQN